MNLLLKKHKNNVIFWFKKNFNSKEITEEIFLQELENKSLNVGSLNKFSKFLAKINNEKSYLFYYKKGLEGSSGQAYIWRTENDGKTRPEHAAKEGQTFVWDEDENPGDDYGCRCRAEFIDENGNKTGLGRVKYDEDGNKFTQELMDKEKGIKTLRDNADKIKTNQELGIETRGKPGGGIGRCGEYTGKAIRSVFPDLGTPKGGLAKNYGEPLENVNFEEISSGNSGILPEKYTPRAGDVMIFESYPGQKDSAGHMQMFDGENWISDFRQKTPWPGNGYLSDETHYAIYRSNDW